MTYIWEYLEWAISNKAIQPSLKFISLSLFILEVLLLLLISFLFLALSRWAIPFANFNFIVLCGQIWLNALLSIKFAKVLRIALKLSPTSLDQWNHSFLFTFETLDLIIFILPVQSNVCTFSLIAHY